MISETYNTDCLEYMKTIPDKYFELAIVDPPYGIGGDSLHSNRAEKNKTHSNSALMGAGKLKNRVLNTMNTKWDNAPTDEYFSELFRISKNQIIWGGNYFDLPPTRCIICWDKVQPWENFSQIEYAWTSFDYPAKLFRFDNRTGDKIHPTQKSIELYTWLLKTFTKQGDKIFDSHLGSQSSRIAAYDLGFDFWGCELDIEYFTQGNERFETHRTKCEEIKSIGYAKTELEKSYPTLF